MQAIRIGLNKKMEEQTKSYKANYSYLKKLLEQTNGINYKAIRDISDHKNIIKKINNTSVEEATDFLI